MDILPFATHTPNFWRFPKDDGEPSIYIATYECGLIRTVGREFLRADPRQEDAHQHTPLSVKPSPSEHQARWYALPCGHDVMSVARPVDILKHGVFCYLCYDAAHPRSGVNL